METHLSQLVRFQSRLLASDSASAVLEDWVGRKSGKVYSLEARKLGGSERPAGAEQRARLSVSEKEALHHRRVYLVAGGRVLSIAENWYVPNRLLPEMLIALTYGMTPFGTAIAELKPRRRTLSIQRLVQLEELGESQRLPPWLLRINALVIDMHDRPLCEVNEIYSRNILI
jgi:hypothetical protein